MVEETALCDRPCGAHFAKKSYLLPRHSSNPDVQRVCGQVTLSGDLPETYLRPHSQMLIVEKKNKTRILAVNPVYTLYARYIAEMLGVVST